MEERKVYTKEECLQMLDDNDFAKVVFRKKDGMVRTMLCTRKLGLVHESLHPKQDPEKKPVNIDNGLPVIDAEAKAWRRFNYDSVISIEPYEMDDKTRIQLKTL